MFGCLGLRCWKEDLGEGGCCYGLEGNNGIMEVGISSLIFG